MPLEMESDAHFKNEAISVYLKNGKSECNPYFRIQNRIKTSECEGLGSILPQMQKKGSWPNQTSTLIIKWFTKKVRKFVNSHSTKT